MKEIVIELNERVILYESKFSQVENLIKDSEETIKTQDLKQLLDKNKIISEQLSNSNTSNIVLKNNVETLLRN
ncbi:hypothetical protein ACQKP0_25505 [Heyndrickxia sp. NPDC080065]|uniref:hypothetical protein n=1 Tax=Heyndrickxia sp. NPDC080065 TaxID=3390568 RepID=UPI003D03B789